MAQQQRIEKIAMFVSSVILLVALLFIDGLAAVLGNILFLITFFVFVIALPMVLGFQTRNRFIPYLDFQSEKDPEAEYDRIRFPWYVKTLIFLATMVLVAGIWTVICPLMLSLPTWVRSFFLDFGWSDPAVEGAARWQFGWGIIALIEYAIGYGAHCANGDS